MKKNGLEKLVFWMEECIKVPFTRFRIGLDGLLGLIPAVGDTLMLILSGILLIQAVRQKAGGKVFRSMVKNILIDFFIGLIPVIGDLFDLHWKANKKNLKLLADHMESRKNNQP